MMPELRKPPVASKICKIQLANRKDRRKSTVTVNNEPLVILQVMVYVWGVFVESRGSR
jgi:hypothetical protein